MDVRNETTNSELKAASPVFIPRTPAALKATSPVFIPQNPVLPPAASIALQCPLQSAIGLWNDNKRNKARKIINSLSEEVLEDKIETTRFNDSDFNTIADICKSILKFCKKNDLTDLIDRQFNIATCILKMTNSRQHKESLSTLELRISFAMAYVSYEEEYKPENHKFLVEEIFAPFTKMTNTKIYDSVWFKVCKLLSAHYEVMYRHHKNSEYVKEAKKYIRKGERLAKNDSLLEIESACFDSVRAKLAPDSENNHRALGKKARAYMHEESTRRYGSACKKDPTRLDRNAKSPEISKISIIGSELSTKNISTDTFTTLPIQTQSFMDTQIQYLFKKDIKDPSKIKKNSVKPRNKLEKQFQKPDVTFEIVTSLISDSNDNSDRVSSLLNQNQVVNETQSVVMKNQSQLLLPTKPKQTRPTKFNLTFFKPELPQAIQSQPSTSSKKVCKKNKKFKKEKPQPTVSERCMRSVNNFFSNPYVAIPSSALLMAAVFFTTTLVT